jgi:hypothetical protein
MSGLPCISILQPYAWLIVNGHKDIENRGWATKFRGRILIHAGKSYSRRTHDEYVEDMAELYGIELPAFEQMQLGGIVGSATITDCVQEHPSRWKILGSWGFVLKDQRVRPFVPYRGQLSIFRVPAEAIEASQPEPTRQESRASTEMPRQDVQDP